VPAARRVTAAPTIVGVMKTLLPSVAVAGFVVVGAIGIAAPALATPLGGQSADDAVSSLQARGYDVQVQGDTNAPLSECIATQVSGLSGSNANGRSGVPAGSTVYVTVSCDDDYDE
jgi:hypothetical protein